MQRADGADPELRFVLKEFPILGPDSQKAHVVSMAFRKMMPDKYPEFHDRLLGGQGRAGEASAIKIALELGADETALREAMKDPAIPGPSRRPTSWPTGCRSPAHPPTSSATRWCSARSASRCWPRRSPPPALASTPPAIWRLIGCAALGGERRLSALSAAILAQYRGAVRAGAGGAEEVHD